MNTCLDTARKELTERHNAEFDELQRKFAVLNMLPDCGHIPIVCNWGKPNPLVPRVWISFSAPAYDPENKWNPVAILAAMEAMGWQMVTDASLCKYDNYRRAIKPCTIAEAAATPHPSRYTFKDGLEVAPYWVEPSQHTKPDFIAFMRGPDGLVYRVSFDIPGSSVSVYAQRTSEAFGRKWAFISGTARVHFPSHWLGEIDGKLTGACVDTSQGVSGWVYFKPDKAKRKASEVLAFLLSDPKKKS